LERRAVRLAVSVGPHCGDLGALLEGRLEAADPPAERGSFEAEPCRGPPQVRSLEEVGVRPAAGEPGHQPWPRRRDEAGGGRRRQRQGESSPPQAQLAPSFRPEEGHDQRALDENGQPGPPLV
jgi:hypothetical protein